MCCEHCKKGEPSWKFAFEDFQRKKIGHCGTKHARSQPLFQTATFTHSKPGTDHDRVLPPREAVHKRDSPRDVLQFHPGRIRWLLGADQLMEVLNEPS